MAYEQDGESDQLISKSTWSLKISGLVCGVLLVLGRSASYGNVTWTPVYHAPSSPLVVLIVEKPSKALAPPSPKLPSIDATSPKMRAASEEVATFSAGPG